jgi:hypothetical protein
MGYSAESRQRILLGHLGARGDCLYATAVARQIKSDYPGCHLTWAVGSMCRAILDGNPYVDQVWEVPMASHEEMAGAWATFHREALQRKKEDDYDEIFFTQIYPDNFKNFDGTVRASIFRGYSRPITVPVTPVVRLTALEVENVRRFAAAHGLFDQPRVILFECTGASGQTFVDIDFARDAAEKIVVSIPESRVVITSHLSFDSTDTRIIDGSVLAFRENAEFSKYCSLLIGCSSGVTWLCTSDWAKSLPTIQLLRRNTYVYASMVHDHEHFGLNADHVIELTDCPADHLVECAKMVYRDGLAETRKIYHENIPLRFDYYCSVLKYLIERNQYRQIIGSVLNTFRRYGFHRELASAVADLFFTRWRTVTLDWLSSVYRRLGLRRIRNKGKDNS